MQSESKCCQFFHKYVLLSDSKKKRNTEIKKESWKNKIFPQRKDEESSIKLELTLLLLPCKNIAQQRIICGFFLLRGVMMFKIMQIRAN